MGDGMNRTTVYITISLRDEPLELKVKAVTEQGRLLIPIHGEMGFLSDVLVSGTPEQMRRFATEIHNAIDRHFDAIGYDPVTPLS